MIDNNRSFHRKIDTLQQILDGMNDFFYTDIHIVSTFASEIKSNRVLTKNVKSKWKD